MLNANNAIVRRLILDSLRYWIAEMHVDGFCFDRASILDRDETGRPFETPPVLWDIQTEPVLAGSKLIAEAWDAAGLYQVGRFTGDSWREWNGRYHDDMRRFMKGDRSVVRLLAQRLLGSPDIYDYREPELGQSIKFVTCHDGFTPSDLVSYNNKPNEANGEENQDGPDDNLSWNCGIEDPSEDAEIESPHRRHIRNFVVILLMSVGTPMLQMGDEMRRTQHGNNNTCNACCQDNDGSWLDWSLLDRDRDLDRFVRTRISCRRRMIGPGREESLEPSLNVLLRHAEFDWHGVQLGKPDWADDSHGIACTIRSTPLQVPLWLHVIINAHWEALDFDLPPMPAASLTGWRRWIDTARDSSEDFTDASAVPLVRGTQYRVAARTTDAPVLEESLSATLTASQIDVSVSGPG